MSMQLQPEHSSNLIEESMPTTLRSERVLHKSAGVDGSNAAKILPTSEQVDLTVLTSSIKPKYFAQSLLVVDLGS